LINTDLEVLPGSFDQIDRSTDALSNDEASRREQDSRLDGARQIMRATDTGAVVELVHCNMARGAYNFSDQECNKDWTGAYIDRVETSRNKPTIEFRQAAGSLDEDGIVILSKICLALCGSAVVESSDDDFFQLV
jgi:hypothetical protein